MSLGRKSLTIMPGWTTEPGEVRRDSRGSGWHIDLHYMSGHTTSVDTKPTLVRNSERSAALKESEDRLARLPGVTRVRIIASRCDTGRVIVYVGVEERGAPTMRFRAKPKGSARLADDIVRLGDEFSAAWMRVVERGDAAEDHSQGHAFAHNPTTRAIQERFVTYAKRDLSQLRLDGRRRYRERPRVSAGR